MAFDIGPKIGIEGEKEFKKALADINQSFKVLGSEMALATSQFDKNDKSVEAVTARNKVLGKEIEAQKDKINTLKAALENSASSFGENDKRTKEWQIKLNNATAELNGMEREVSTSIKSIDEMGKETENTGSKLDDLGKIAAGVGAAVAAGIAAAGATVAATGKAIFDMSMNTADAGDRVDKSSQKLGLSAKGFQEWDYIIAQNGGNIDSLGVGMKTLQKTMSGLTEDGDKSSEAFKAIGINFEDIKDKSPEEAFNMTVRALQNMPPGADKSAAAMKLLGKQGMELMPLLNQTAESTDALRKQANDLGMVMSNDAVNASVAFGDSLDAMKKTFIGVKNSIGAELLPGFTSITDGITGLISGQAGASDQITAGVKNTVKSIGDIIPRVLGVVSTIGDTVVKIAPSIIKALVSGVVSNIPMLIDLALKIVLALVNGIITSLPILLNGAVQIILGLVQGITQALPQLIPAILSALLLMVQTLIDNMPLILDAALQLIIGLTQGILAALPVLVAALPDIITGIVNFLIGAIPQIIDAGITLLISLVEALPQIIQAIVDAIPLIIKGIINALLGNIDKIIDAGVRLLVALVQNLPIIIIEVVKAIPQIIGAIVGAIIESIPKMVEVGGNLLKGLWQGISDAGEWLWNKISGFFGGIVDRIKDFFGIHSPATKVWPDLGNNMAAGVGIGFVDEMKNVSKQINNSIPRKFNTSINVVEGVVNGMSTVMAAAPARTAAQIPINLMLDGRVLASLLYDPLANVIRQKGKSFA